MAIQRLLVGIQCGLQFATASQGIATIVVIRRAVALGEALRGAGVVAGLIKCHAFPA